MQPLDDPRLKISWANKHFKALQDEVERFLDSHPYGVITELDEKTGKYILRAKINAEPPVEWGLVIGDIAHNLRSALDHLIWQLCLLQTSKPHKRAEFPIFLEAGRYNATRISQLTPRQKALIEGLQPYHGSNPASHPLWILHEINNADKHRLIQLAGRALEFKSLGFNQLWGYDFIDLNVGGGLVEDGAQIADFTLIQRDPKAHVYMNLDFTFDIVFGKGSPVPPGTPLVSTLADIVSCVQGIVTSFEPEFIKLLRSSDTQT
jgi:hypothetical protein